MKTANVIGNSFKVDFGQLAFRLDFHSETRMTWQALNAHGQPEGQDMTVTIHRTEVRPNVFMVYWSEPALGATVVHVQDFDNDKVWTNITTKDGQFINLAGTLTPY